MNQESFLKGWELAVAEASDLWSRLDAQAISARGDLAKKETEVAKAKAVVERHPAVTKFLEVLQQRVNGRAVGVYEDLLTAIVGDVLPGDREIKLNLGISKGLPSLDFELYKGGKEESIMDGSGGSVANVISAGLRLIALARSNHRQFIAFDEPDCWIKPSRVPKFASVIGQVARDIGMQVLLVSHHDPSYFDGVATLLELKTDKDGNIVAEVDGKSRQSWPNDHMKGIRWIRLENFMSHKNTYIPLFPGVTCLTGENDLGKSAVLAALRSVFNDRGSSDAFVRHGCKSFRITIGFEGGIIVQMDHFKDKSPKRVWEMRLNGEKDPINDGKTNIPQWLEDFAPMGLVKGMNVHFTNQKTPVFLIDETEGTKKASILSVGRESGYLVMLQAASKKRYTTANRVVSEGEANITLLKEKLKILKASEEECAKIASLREEACSLIEQERALISMGEKWNRLLTIYEELPEIQRKLTEIHVELPEKPKMDIDSWKGRRNRMEKLISSVSSLPIFDKVDMPQQPNFNNQNLREKLNRLSALKSGLSVSLPSKVEIPNENISTLATWRQKLVRVKKLSILHDMELEKVEMVDNIVQGASISRHKYQKAIELHREMGRLTAELSILEERNSEHIKKVKDFIEENPMCPTCYKPASIEDVIKGKHD